MSTRDGTEMFIKLREGKLEVVKPKKKRVQRLTNNEKALILDYADTYNEEFKKCAGAYVGRLNIKRMLINFLKAHKEERKQ